MIPGEIRSKIPLEMTVAYHSSYLNEMSSCLRRIHLIQSEYFLFCGHSHVMLLRNLISKRFCFLHPLLPKNKLFTIVPLLPFMASEVSLKKKKNKRQFFSQGPSVLHEYHLLLHICICLCALSHLPGCFWCGIEMISEPFFMMLACFVGMWILVQDLVHTPLHPPVFPSSYPCHVPLKWCNRTELRAEIVSKRSFVVLTMNSF